MQRVLLKIGLFLLCNVLIIIGILTFLYQRDKNLKVHTSVTESVVMGLQQHKHYNFLIMGSSHGRNMVRGENYFNLKSKTRAEIACLAESAAGVIPEYFWLKYFYHQSNQADTIFYILDPFVFFTSKWNEDLHFLSNEPFRWDVFMPLLLSSVSNDVKFNYIKSKFENPWLEKRGVFIQDETGSLQTRDTEAVYKRIESLYPDGYAFETFMKYKDVLEDIVDCANQHHSKVVFILPPTLLGEEPGYYDVFSMLKDMELNDKVAFYDFSDSISNPSLYYNHDHLNASGMEWYLSNCLSLVLQRKF